MCRNKQHNGIGKPEDYPTEFEDALYFTGTGKFHTFLLFVTGAGIAGVMMETFGVSFLLPSAQCDFNLQSTDKGLLSAIYPIGMICGSHLWGYLGDTRGRKTVLVTTLLLDGICAILSSFSHAFWLFLIFRFTCGFLTVGSGSIVYSYLGEFHSTPTRSKNLMWLSVFIGLGIGLQPGIAWLVIPQQWEWHLPWCVYKSWRVFIVVCSLCSIIPAILILLLLPETPKFLMVYGKKEESLNVLRKMYSWNTGNSPEKYPVKSVVLIEEGATQISSSKEGSSIYNLLISVWNQTAPIFKPPFVWKTLLACFVQYGLYASANGVSLWLPEIFNQQAAYAARYPDSPASFCGVYAALKEHQAIPNNSVSSASLSYNLLNTTKLYARENNTFVLTCNNETLFLQINDFDPEPINSNLPLLKCQNGTFDSALLGIDINNGQIVLNSLNMTQYQIIQNMTLLSGVSENSECNSEVDISAFQNTLVTGAACILSYVCVAMIIEPLGKKRIIVTSLIVAGIAGCCLDEVYAGWEFLGMALIFVTLSGMCITIMVSAVIEIFPTNLRAMAVGLSLMFGRLGSFTAHLLMGSLLESNCTYMAYILGGLCTCCGIVSFFLPAPKKNS